MRDVIYLRPRSAEEAVAMHGAQPGARYFAGGTTLYDLMKLGVEAPAALVDVSAIDGMASLDTSDRRELRIGAMMPMSELAEHPVLRAEFPALAESLWKAASQQLRNMASVGGNLLQRTRCAYFRGGAEYACNKRHPGSGCAAIAGLNRGHALFGGSDACVAVYPGDWAVALTAFDGVIDVAGARGPRSIAVRELYREPGATPQHETVIAADELIVRIRVPRGPSWHASTYHKIRDRESYAFALVSAAVGVWLAGGRVSDARIALGGVATRPWRAPAAEALLVGAALTRVRARQAAQLCFADARALEHNAFKIALGIDTVTDALMLARERV